MKTLILVLALLSLPVSAGTTTSGGWKIKTSTDPMTDVEEASAVLASVDTMPNVLGIKERSSLLLRCREGRNVEVYIVVPSIVGSDYSSDSATARYRFDKDPADTVRGGRSTDHQAFFFPDAVSWMDILEQKDGSRFLVEIPIYDSVPQVATFNLSGSKKATTTVLTSCEEDGPSRERRAAERKEAEAEEIARLQAIEDSMAQVSLNVERATWVSLTCSTAGWRESWAGGGAREMSARIPLGSTCLVSATLKGATQFESSAVVEITGSSAVNCHPIGISVTSDLSCEQTPVEMP